MRLPRPNISLELKLLVICHQLGDFDAKGFVASAKRQRMLGTALDCKLAELAQLLGCEIADLRLDHHPALENREKVVELPNGRTVTVIIVPAGAKVIRYIPDANDPEHLRYRSHVSHDIKTRVRGDGAQFADNVIAKRERRRQRKLSGKRRFKKIPQRRNPWPPKGSRPLGQR